MSKRRRNLLLAAVAVPCALVVLMRLGDGGATRLGDGGARPPPPAPSPPPSPSAPDEARGYWVSVAEVDGLPESAPPGTRMELWVAWEPPVTARPRVERLVQEVTLERIAPPVTPQGPAAALLSVPAARVADVLYADRWGALSVAILP